jgi:pimeloyl-ACP methyl ester carboxylesterase
MDVRGLRSRWLPGRLAIPEMRTHRMLLIHGAWQGSWAWDAWLPELARLGWHAEAIDLPGNGCDPLDNTAPGDVSLKGYVNHVVANVLRHGESVVLVGHSGGGITATQVAEALPGRIACVVYLAGMMLPSGLSYRALLHECQAEHPEMDLSGIAPYLRKSADGLLTEVPVDAARRIFLHDAEPDTALQLAEQLRPQPNGGRDIAPIWTAARFGRVPRIYVEALDDRSLRLPVQRLMQAMVPGALRLSIACGHLPQVVRSRESAELVCTVLAGQHPAYKDDS